jgi:hypothetical protein
MSETSSKSSADYVLLNQLADEFAARYRANERPTLQEYIDRHRGLKAPITQEARDSFYRLNGDHAATNSLRQEPCEKLNKEPEGTGRSVRKPWVASG